MIADRKMFAAIARAIGTPYYCYNATDIRVRFQLLKAQLPDGIGYLYSLKANPNKNLVHVLHAQGTGCEVCSLAELETALAAGVEPQHVIFLGPAKSAIELGRCVDLGIRAVVVESLSELILLDRIASSKGLVQAVALRINPAFTPNTAKLVMSGKATQFGIDEDQLGDAVHLLVNCKHVVLVGIHVYVGSRIFDVGAIRNNTKSILELAVKTEEFARRRLAFVDVGGGFGVNYFEKEAELDLEALGNEMAGVVDQFRRRCPATQILIELGRYLVAPAGVFVTSVRYIKECKGKHFAICDGGSNCHAAAAGVGSLFRRNFPIARLTGSGFRKRVYTLTGPLCTPTDVIGEDITLEELASGDLVGIYQSGAYGPSASPVYFLGFGHPAEVLIDEGRVELIRNRTGVEELLRHQVAVPIDVHLNQRTGKGLSEKDR
jgi:diaminopimelate decarboxylase